MEQTNSMDAQRPRPTVLVVLSTGLWGASWNVEFMRGRLQEAGGQSVLVHTATSNFVLKSYSGVDVCGMRLAEEVRSLLVERDDLADVRRVSIIGYSLGGLFVRYAVGVLHEEGLFSQKGITLDKVITAATPHLGVRSSPRGVMGRMKNRVLETVGNVYGGVSMEQMTLTDDGPSGKPLLLHMSLPGTRYFDGLAAARGVYFYANARRDSTVSYCTAGVAERNTYRGRKDVRFLEGFPYIAGVSRVCEDPDLVRVHAARGASAEDEDRHAVVVERAPGEKPHDGEGPEATMLLCADADPASAESRTEATAHEEQGAEGKKPGIVNGGVGAAAATVVIAPFLLVHFVTLVLPMRITYTLLVGREETDGKDGKFYKAPEGVDASTAGSAASGGTERGRLEREEDRSDRYTREVLDKSDDMVDKAMRPLISSIDGYDPGPSGRFTDERINSGRPKKEAPVGSKAGGNGIPQGDSGRAGGGGRASASSDTFDGGVTGVPAAIRRNLGRPELGIQRVDVCLPDFHTHGTIIVRRSTVSREGASVIDHMAKVLFG